jgi:hypothetical protein
VRTGEREALDALALEPAQRDQLILGLDAFGGDRAAECSGQADQRGDDRLIARVTGQPGDEALIDLDRVERVLLEPGEGRIAGAEIIQSDSDAARLELAQSMCGDRVGAHQGGLRELEDRAAWSCSSRGVPTPRSGRSGHCPRRPG